MTIKLVLLSNIAASAFGEGVPADAITSEWVGFTQDDERYLIAGRNRDGDAPDAIVAHFDNDTSFAEFRESGFPLELFALMGGHSYIDTETLGEDVVINVLKEYDAEDDIDFDA
ncbi:hypothetical protein ABR33_00125 [Enterobacter bugandensis]|uniref:hypothetical protein n=1 Tax=Enterobacter bugandensis TaxID=881260 RepID=UPI0006436840|nr:hypothetical protein [Enterobacter bugandensis]KLQ40425.1 hypothetical protein ABR33_00125 [Enterobacter bugandensis]